MNAIRMMGALALALTLAACGQPEQASRSYVVPQGGLTLATQGPTGVPAGATVMAAKYHVVDVVVNVPSSLRSSEANVFYPIADIVWRGDPLGNRHEQVRAIIRDAAATATAGMQTGPEVTVELQINHFHSVTEKTRYSVGGIHSTHMTMTVRDANTGAILDGPRAVLADVKASGGGRALAEEAAGRTMKVVITERLVQVLRRELSAPVAPAVTAAVSQGTADPVLVAN
jgi:hypothetical protein